MYKDTGTYQLGKFERDVQYILMLEDQWVGKAVVYRNKDTGTYQLGKETDLSLHLLY